MTLSYGTALHEDLFDDLKWRGLIAQSTDEVSLRAALGKPLALYIGFDPTAPSLHVGNLVVLLVLRRFQMAGHQPIALVGGATGLVGDPSGKNAERNLNTTEIVAQWVGRIRQQLQKFLDFDAKGNPAILANNLDWTARLSAIDFLRDVGKYFSVSQMLSKDAVAARLSKDGISYTEFSYQVLQAFDYLELYQRRGCTLQLGGSDQWGNITAGLDLIRKVRGVSAHAMTIPLLTKADGTKFGKTAAGAVWLDPEMTSPFSFFQYWLNSDDADVINFIKVFSLKSRLQIESLAQHHAENPGARQAQRELARELTALVHSAEAAQRVELAADALFGQANLADLDAATLGLAMAELPRTTVSLNAALPTWVDALHATGLVPSKSAARRVLKEGGAYLNNERVVVEDFRLQPSHFLCGKYAVLRKGKREIAAVELLSEGD